MERLIARVRKFSQLQTFSDALLISLLSESDLHPDLVQQGVVLFEKNEPTTYWYLLLSGEVQLYSETDNGDFNHLQTLGSGALFGDLSTIKHSCSCIVSRSAQLIRIAQNHFLSIYNRHGDHLQPSIIIMHDIVSDEDLNPSDFPSVRDAQTLPGHISIENSASKIFPVSTKGTPSSVPLSSYFSQMVSPTHEIVTSPERSHRSFIEFHKPESLEVNIREAAFTLYQKMISDNSQLIRNIITSYNNVQNCMIGAEMIDWLLTLFVSTSSTSSSLSRIQMSAIWQVLLNNNIILNVSGEHVFNDNATSYYRWSQCKNLKKKAMQTEDILGSISLLSSVAPETLFLMIVSKPRFERSPEELEFVYDEIMHIKALSHLSTMVKRQLASFVEVEHYINSGSIVFQQGDTGTHWYIVLKGAVEVSSNGKTLCVLREGDDFGKLALVNDLPRAATIVTYENDSIFLIVDKHKFNQVLHQVESNTVRLREFGEDVLVLEKVDIPVGAALESYTVGSSTFNFGYSVMAGKAEKILEYVLETRIDALPEDITEVDLFVEDFILTHDAFMPVNSVCNFLKSYYCHRRHIANDLEVATNLLGSQWGGVNEYSVVGDPGMIWWIINYLEVVNDLLWVVNYLEIGGDAIADPNFVSVRYKRRVVLFVYVWCSLLRINFFLNPVTNSFVEELFCLVIDDRNRLEGMEGIVTAMTAIRSTREKTQLVLARHPAVVLDCGVLSAQTPCPVLPTDVCNQIIYLADTTCFVLPIRVDKTSEEICELSRRRMRFSAEPLHLVEVKSNGEKLIFSSNDRAISTVLSLNSKLYVVNKEEIISLVPTEDQNGPSPMSHSSILHLIDAQELAHQLFLFHLQLLRATNSNELLYQVIGRESFPLNMPFNLDLLVRRFNEVQHWATTEVLLSVDDNRVNVLKKFIEISTHARDNRDLLTVFAITLGLSHTSVRRLTLTWSKLSLSTRKSFSELENLLDPTRNHRMYRNMVSKMSPPFIPFVPLILKDLMFIHQGNKSFYNGLVNFEKMHMFANTFRGFQQCKGMQEAPENQYIEPQSLIRNLRVGFLNKTCDNSILKQNQHQNVTISVDVDPSLKKLQNAGNFTC